MTNRVINIALLWHAFGHANLGVDALARCNTNIIREAAGKLGLSPRFTTIGTGQNYGANVLPEDVTIGPAPRLKSMLLSRSGFFKSVQQSDIVFDIGEGDSFTDIYGVRRYAKFTASKIAALIAGAPLVLAPQTIGPFDNAMRRWLASVVMRQAKAVYTRDGLSTQFLRKSKVYGNSSEFTDVAFALPFAPQQKSKDRLRVGLNVSGLLYNEGYTGKNELGMVLDYKRLTHRLIKHLLSKERIEIHLISHVNAYGGADNDYPVLELLAKKYPSLVTAPKFATSELAKSYMSGMDYMVAGRMHACIGAFSAGVPVMPIAYSRKFNGLFRSLGYSHMVDGKACTTDDALSKIISGLECREELAIDVSRGLEEARRRLDSYRDHVERLLKETAGD